VSVERKRYALPTPFLVIATQNPLEHQGTFPLPESQLDRFLMSLEIGYPPVDEERELLLSGGVEETLKTLEPALDREELQRLQEASREVRVTEKIADYILSLAKATREGGEFVMGVSTRGVQSLYRASQALALCEGRDFVVPDDVQRLAIPVWAHRVSLRKGSGGTQAARDAIERVTTSVSVPL
ncbi:MAG: MoxR family ATPase, partial [Thermoanaerobaculia bacterium]|nr:MoxR family ATPase [Thermoanaerobaculia bacterium]